MGHSTLHPKNFLSSLSPEKVKQEHPSLPIIDCAQPIDSAQNLRLCAPIATLQSFVSSGLIAMFAVYHNLYFGGGLIPNTSSNGGNCLRAGTFSVRDRFLYFLKNVLCRVWTGTSYDIKMVAKSD